MKKTPRIIARRIAGPDAAVVSVQGGGRKFCKTPCPGCPWRVANDGDWPAEAFRISAHTAYDAAFEMFSCHEAGADRPAVCGGFLLRNADNNIGVRLAIMARDFDRSSLIEPDAPLHRSYREMAVANGVSPDDPVLARCRANDED